MGDSNDDEILEEIQSRRRAIALEDKALAEMETSILAVKAVKARWAEYQQKVLRRVDVTAPIAISQPLPGVLVPKAARTKNDLIVEALANPRNLWQTANQIRDYMTEVLGSEVPMSSVSPALTALKNNGTLVRRDMQVALTLRVEHEEPGFLNETGHPQGDGPVTGGDAANLQPEQPDRAQERG